MGKQPSSRGFTVAEKRALAFERVSLYALMLVTVIAAAISFIALRAVGKDAGLGSASFLLPIAIDGFGVACSVGIIRSVASGEGFGERASEWVGLAGALGLSILGNVHHALIVGAVTLPNYVKVSYAFAIPVIVAYGIHVYGRAMSKGISAHVLADNPAELIFDLRHLGDTHGGPVSPVARAPQPRAARATPPAPVRAPEPVAAAQPRAHRAHTDTSPQARARAIYDRMIEADPITKPDAAVIHREAEVPKNVATTRRWVQSWWEETEASMGMTRPEPTSSARDMELTQRTA